MVFTVWLDEFCVLHAKLQTMAKILEEHLVLDTINNIKKFMIPVRSMDIENFREESEHKSRGWYSNGQPSYEHNYENGKKHGTRREWYKNGQINYDQNYKNGELHGISRGWYANGEIAFEDNYEHGQLHGICKEWYTKTDYWSMNIVTNTEQDYE